MIGALFWKELGWFVLESVIVIAAETTAERLIQRWLPEEHRYVDLTEEQWKKYKKGKKKNRRKKRGAK